MKFMKWRKHMKKFNEGNSKTQKPADNAKIKFFNLSSFFKSSKSVTILSIFSIKKYKGKVR